MKKIPLFKIYWDKEDIKSITSIIKSGSNWAIGKAVEDFEKQIAEYLKIKYCVTFNSGTSALHSILLAYGIKTGDEVIVPSFSFIASANAPLFVGAKPIFADIEQESLGLDTQSVEEKITNKTKAIIAVHYGGNPCKIEKLRKIADKYGLILIEDAAEAMGSKSGNKFIGSFGNSSILSFCQNKIISTGEGGAIITDSERIYNKVKLIRSHGRNDNVNYFSSSDGGRYISLGYNFRLSNIQASLGISQLNKIDKLIQKRRMIASFYLAGLKKLNHQIHTIREHQDRRNVYQLFTICIKTGNKNRKGLIIYLNNKGIKTKIYFQPIHKTNFYRHLKYYPKLPITEKMSEQVLSLPIFPGMKKEEVNYIIEKIKEYFEGIP